MMMIFANMGFETFLLLFYDDCFSESVLMCGGGLFSKFIIQKLKANADLFKISDGFQWFADPKNV